MTPAFGAMAFLQPKLNEDVTKGRFKGHVAVITGGASGIARECVRRFANDGASVAFFDINREEGVKYEAELRSEGYDVTFFDVDVTDKERCMTTVEAIAQQHGGSINYLVNCAVQFVIIGLEAKDADWEKALPVNVTGYANMVQACYPHMKKASAGDRCVINMASTGAHVANKNAWVYHASKGAGLQMTRCMALDLSKDGIRVNSVSPAAIWTQTIGKMVNNDKEFHRTTWGKFHMLKRCGESAEVAAVVAFLCSRDAGFITGADIKVDGGYTTIGPERHGEEVGVKLADLSKEPQI